MSFAQAASMRLFRVPASNSPLVAGDREFSFKSLRALRRCARSARGAAKSARSSASEAWRPPTNSPSAAIAPEEPDFDSNNNVSPKNPLEAIANLGSAPGRAQEERGE